MVKTVTQNYKYKLQHNPLDNSTILLSWQILKTKVKRLCKLGMDRSSATVKGTGIKILTLQR